MAARVGGGGSLQVKVVLLGEGCVGKTSIVLRYVQNQFNDKHIQTLQVRGGGRENLYICMMVCFVGIFSTEELNNQQKKDLSEHLGQFTCL